MSLLSCACDFHRARVSQNEDFMMLYTLYTLWNGYKQLFCSASSSWETACGRNAWAAEISCHWASKPRKSSASLKYSLWHLVTTANEQAPRHHLPHKLRNLNGVQWTARRQRLIAGRNSLEELLSPWFHLQVRQKSDSSDSVMHLVCMHELTWHGWHGTMWFYVTMCMSGRKDSKECSLGELFWTPPCISSPHLSSLVWILEVWWSL